MEYDSPKYSGRVACKGYATGIARIINTYDDLHKVQAGDILVTAQTDMNYTPFLQICSGLITEHGGRYCHASIYSRENNLPCIIAVENAREILIDGSVLILDAENNEIYYGEQ